MENETQPQEQQEQVTVESLQAEVDKWSGLSKKMEKEKNQALAERDALQNQVETFEKELNSERLSKTRIEVARRYSLADDVMEFLTGGDEESLTAQAEKLSKLTSSPDKTPEETQNFLIKSEGQGATPLNSPEISDFLKHQFGY